MGSAIVIWSKKNIHQRKIILDCVQAAYDSCLKTVLDNYANYGYKGTTDSYPKYFVIAKDAPDNNPMIFHFSAYEDQVDGIEKWIDTSFVNKNREKIIEPELYRLAVSEDFDSEMSFHFSYHYLKINQDQFITLDDYIIDWDLIKETYSKGFRAGWL